MLCSVAEQILERETVRLPIARKKRAEAFLQQATTLLQNQLKLFDTSRAEDVVGNIVLLTLLQLLESYLQGLDAARKIIGIDPHVLSNPY